MGEAEMATFSWQPGQAWEIVPGSPQDPLREYWSWNDPRWGQGRNPDQYAYDQYWNKLLEAAGFDMTKAYGPIYETVDIPKYDDQGYITGYETVTRPKMVAATSWEGDLGYSRPATGYTPEYYQAIDALRAAGYDVRQKNPNVDTYNTYFGIIGPGGKVLQDIKVKGGNASGWDIFGQDLLAIAPIVLPFVAGPLAGALGGGALGAAGSGAILGGVNAAIRGGDVLKGALTGGITGGIGSIASGAVTGASALDAGMDVYPALDFAAPSALDAGMGAYPATEFTPPSALDAGMDVYPELDLGAPSALDAGMDVYPSAPETPTSPEYVRTSADRAAQYGKEGYGPGMSGTQTSVYDSVLNTTGNKAVADLFSNAVGAGTSVLDWVKENPTAGRALFSAAGALLNTAGGGGSGGSGGYVDSGYRPTISRGGFNANPQARQMPLSPVGLLSTPAQGQAMSGLWRYGLLGG